MLEKACLKYMNERDKSVDVARTQRGNDFRGISGSLIKVLAVMNTEYCLGNDLPVVFLFFVMSN
jgi:hypothetical protein